MILKDAKSPNRLNKTQLMSLEKELKPTITSFFNMTNKVMSSEEKQALAIKVLDTLKRYLTDNKQLTDNPTNTRLYIHDSYTIITQLNKELSTNLLTVKGIGLSNIIILSTSTVLDAFEEVLGYLGEFNPELNPKGDVFYIVPSGDKDFALYRFGLSTLENQYRHLLSNNLL